MTQHVLAHAGNWTLTGPLPEPFVGNSIIPLPGVGALIAGGGNSAVSNATAIFHQLERKWTPTGGPVLAAFKLASSRLQGASDEGH